MIDRDPDSEVAVSLRLRKAAIERNAEEVKRIAETFVISPKLLRIIKETARVQKRASSIFILETLNLE